MVFKQSEREFQASVTRVVEMLGGLVYHTYDSRRSAMGYPDLTIVTLNQGVIFAELKSVKGRVTDSQWVWLRGLPDHQAYLWRPEDFDDAVRIIQFGHRLDSLAPSPSQEVATTSSRLCARLRGHLHRLPNPLTYSSVCAIVRASKQGREEMITAKRQMIGLAQCFACAFYAKDCYRVIWHIGRLNLGETMCPRCVGRVNG